MIESPIIPELERRTEEEQNCKLWLAIKCLCCQTSMPCCLHFHRFALHGKTERPEKKVYCSNGNTTDGTPQQHLSLDPAEMNTTFFFLLFCTLQAYEIFKLYYFPIQPQLFLFPLVPGIHSIQIEPDCGRSSGCLSAASHKESNMENRDFVYITYPNCCYYLYSTWTNNCCWSM